ncbi:uncharacterized protein LOC113865479 isoform X2 [Abrus precatorius]|nr:uncharacterized protein LOC113865479 isoform X2 [Abrus precatorius]XP_027355867.1 uncharacterized protein LOC113865479 isoform X2 [Abrus precatorius]
MDIEDAENKVSVSSVILNSIGYRQNEVLSPEDLAWVDSCLNKDSDVSESDWIPLKNALLEIISSQSQSFSANVEETKIPPYSISSERSTLELNQQSSTSHVENLSEASSTFHVKPVSMAIETSSNQIPDDEKSGTLPSFTFQGNPFLPTYNEDLKENETIDFGRNLDSSTYEMEHLAENIFKIWDLDIPSEDGELVKQLDKALSENSFQTVPSPFDDSAKWKDMEEGSLDDLIASIADLSLNKNV